MAKSNNNPHSTVDTLSNTPFSKCKLLSEMLPALKVIAKDYGFNLNRPHNMRVAIRIASNSVKNN